jgi:hypothetical protein
VRVGGGICAGTDQLGQVFLEILARHILAIVNH